MGPLNRYTRCDVVSLSENEVSKLIDESKPWKERKPIGFRFNPSPQALAKIHVDELFNRKDNFVLHFFKYINVYGCEPSELSGYANEFGEGKMYFFTRIKKKNSKGRTMFDRTAGGGCWKKDGKISDITIDVEDNSEKLSVCKTPLAFYEKGKIPGKDKKTSWRMEEYMLKDKQTYENGENSGQKSDVLVLCVIYSNQRNHESGEEPDPMPDMEGGSYQNLATEPSISLHPPIQNYPNALDYPNKRHCPPYESTPEIYTDFSPDGLELTTECFQSGNEDGSNQQQHPNSHGSSDAILLQHSINPGMGCFSSQQKPAGITLPCSHNSNMHTLGAHDSNRNDFFTERQENSPISASVECPGLNCPQLNVPDSIVNNCSMKSPAYPCDPASLMQQPTQSKILLGQSHESSTRIDYSSDPPATAAGFEQGTPVSRFDQCDENPISVVTVCPDQNLFNQNANLDDNVDQSQNINYWSPLSSVVELFLNDYQGGAEPSQNYPVLTHPQELQSISHLGGGQIGTNVCPPNSMDSNLYGSDYNDYPNSLW